MEGRQDPDPDPPNDLPSNLPYKKRSLAQGQPAAEQPAAEPPPAERNTDAAADARMHRNTRMNILRNKRMRLREFQEQAYYSVLRAFMAESRDLSSKRVTIMKDLMNELKVTYRQHQNFQGVLNKDDLIRELRGDLPQEKEQRPPEQQVKSAPEPDVKSTPAQEVKSTPLRISLKKPRTPASQEKNKSKVPSGDKHEDEATPSGPEKKPSSSAGGASGGSWGKVSPESLIGRKVFVRLPGDDEFIEFVIKQYDDVQELHSLESETDTMDDPYSWVDLRYIPSQDIMWEGEDPGISDDECSLKPGQTVLRTTSTTGREEESEQNLFKIPPLPSKETTSKKPFRKGNDQEQADAVVKIEDLSLHGKVKSEGEQPQPYETKTGVEKLDDDEGNTSTNRQDSNGETTT